MRVLLSLDLSTTCTGWSIFDIDTKKLIEYGIIKPSTKINGLIISKLKYPRQQLLKMIDISFKIKSLIERCKPTHIVIEEIAGSKNRLGQKVLDSLHFIILYHIQEYIDLITFYDVSGPNGWRYHLGIKLSEQDKIFNKEGKKLNKLIAKGNTKLPIIGPKDLACRYVNGVYGLSLDPQKNQFDNDIGDSVAIGSAFLKFRLSK